MKRTTRNTCLGTGLVGAILFIAVHIGPWMILGASAQADAPGQPGQPQVINPLPKGVTMATVEIDGARCLVVHSEGRMADTVAVSCK